MASLMTSFWVSWMVPLMALLDLIVSCWASQMVSLIVLGLLDGFLLDLAEGSLMASSWTSWMVYLMAFC
jgi:hypothetical protein